MSFLFTPVSYPDLSKGCKDILTKDFPSGDIKLEVKTTTLNGMNFFVNGKQDSDKIVTAEAKTKFAKNGIK